MKTTLEAGFIGTADISWVVDVPMMSGRSSVGALCDDMKHKSRSTVARVIFPVDRNNGKRCFIGPTTHDGSEHL